MKYVKFQLINNIVKVKSYKKKSNFIQKITIDLIIT